jgi:HNH endonuclease
MRKYGFRDNIALDPDAAEAIKRGGDQVAPVLLGRDLLKTHRTYWTYKGAFYSTAEELEPDEVQALLEERENRKRLKIARAKSLAAMAEQLDTRGRRENIAREVKLEVWQRDGGQCVSCSSNSALEFDHIIPLSLGGSNTVRNLQLLCETCNRRKGATLGGEDVSPSMPTTPSDNPADREEKLVTCPTCGKTNRLRSTSKNHRCGSCSAEL